MSAEMLDMKKPYHAHTTMVGQARLFPHLTEAMVMAQRIGTPAYQAIHPYNGESGPSHTHYKSLVTPSMRKPNKSMAHHLGMPVLYGGKNGGGV
jgi:hypothetical protein